MVKVVHFILCIFYTLKRNKFNYSELTIDVI